MVQDRTTGNPLSAESLSLFMATSLPKGDNSEVKTSSEAIALAVHAGMLAVGFRLVGLGEDQRIEARADVKNPQPLPNAWNITSTYSFCYAHPQSAMEFLVKVNRLGGKAIVNAIAVGQDKHTHFDVTTKDYLSESQLPVSLPKDMSTEDATRKMQDLFISTGRLNDLGALLKTSIIQKLAPGLQKLGYEDSSASRASTNNADRPDSQTSERLDPRQPPRQPEPARPHPYDDPLAARPQEGRSLPEPMPGFDDELDLTRRRGNDVLSDRYPVNIGENDLYPPGLGPHDAIRPYLGDTGLPRPGSIGGGMHPTFDDPLFQGPAGHRGYDARAPPGARYDPLGPGDPLRDGRGGMSRFPGGGGGFGGSPGGPPNPFGGFGGNDFI